TLAWPAACWRSRMAWPTARAAARPARARSSWTWTWSESTENRAIVLGSEAPIGLTLAWLQSRAIRGCGGSCTVRPPSKLSESGVHRHRGLPGELPRFGPCAIRSSQDRWRELPIPLGRPGLYATVRRGADTRPGRRAAPRPGKTASRLRRPTEAGHGTETCGRSGLSSTKGYVADFSWWGDPSLRFPENTRNPGPRSRPHRTGLQAARPPRGPARTHVGMYKAKPVPRPIRGRPVFPTSCPFET